MSSNSTVISSIKDDVEELRKLLSVATRPKVKDILSVEIRKLETQIINLAEKLQREETISKTDAKATAPSSKPISSYTKKITEYGWDQSDKFLKIYLTSLNGVQKLAKENITSEYGSKSVKITVTGLEDKNYELHIGNLFKELIPGESYFKIKTDMILVMLKKKEETTWPYITEQEKKKKEKGPKFDDNKDPGAGMMDIMKQMYDDGDDDMKRTIAKAWHESQAKRASGDML